MVLAMVLVLVLAVVTLLVRAESALRDELADDIASTLQREAALVASGLGTSSGTELQDAVRRMSLTLGHRISVIDSSGALVADSDFPAGPMPAVENHAARAEVAAALAGDTGRARRASATVNREFLYVAVPAPQGVVRLAEDLSRIEEVASGTRRATMGAAVLALLVGLGVAIVLSRSVARPLTLLARSADAIASGAPPRFPKSGITEVDTLVRALRDMHRQQGERFDRLRAEEAQSAAVVESMVEGVIASDARGRITTANAAARQLLGYSPGDPLPDARALFRAREAREVVEAALDGAVEQSRTVELDGRTMLLNARALPGGGAVMVLHDLTDVRRLENVRRDFVANVSHELKTPLTSISGYAETLLTDRPDDETVQKFLGTILGNSRRMHRLVDDLLDLSRIESGHWQPSPARMSAGAAVREAVASFMDRAAEREVTLEAAAPDPDVAFEADPEAVRQVLSNLIDNALRYTPAGGRVIARAEQSDGGVVLSVSDTGSGIPQEHLPRIFERFYRADPSRSREEGGTGLGLSIVRHLVESHGGRVSAESALGHGTIVRCWLPN